MISIIIPVYNGDKFVASCLDSIYSNKIDNPFEVIVVDDGSTDDTGKIVQYFPCFYFRIEKSGVAAARNFGIKKAKGDIIFFFDADVRLNNDTISKFLKHFHDDKDAYIIQGRWNRNSPITSFSSRFFVSKYTYNFLGLFKKEARLEVGTLETGCLAMRADVFSYFKGFDERYKFSGGEEHEFGMRLVEKYKIYYYPDIFVEHAFGSIFGCFKKIYRRTINFSILFFKTKNKDFMRLYRSCVPIQDKVSIMIIFLLFVSCFLFFFNVGLAFSAMIMLLLFYFFNISKFLSFLVSKESFFFAIAGAVADFIIMVPRLCGILMAIYIFYILGEKDFKV